MSQDPNAVQSNALSLNRLRSLSVGLQTHAESHGIPVNCRTEKIESLFTSLSMEEREKYLKRFGFIVETICEMAREDFAQEQRALWHVMKRLGVRPPSELFNYIGPGDCIEIYDAFGVQIFRNLEFCKVVTYSLHEMLLLPWNELYDRDPKVTDQIMAAVGRVMTEKKLIVDLGVDVHACRENRPGATKTYEVEMKYFAPLFSATNVAEYFIAGSRIDPVDS